MKSKTLLEKGIPVKLLNTEAGKEKLAVPPTVNLHKYATRKPLITSRMVVAASLLNELDLEGDEDFNSLIGLDRTLKNRAYRKIPYRLVKKIDDKYDVKPTVLDPFAGTGTIPFEALRLGLNVVALDYNPVANLIMKGTIEYPIKYRKTIYSDVEKYAKTIYSKLSDDLSFFYPKYDGVEPRAYINAWAVECPTCGNITPLVNNWILDGSKNIVIEYDVDQKGINYKIIKSETPQEGNVRRGKATCIFCSSDISNEHLTSDILNNEREIILAIYLDNREFVLPRKEDLVSLEKANQYLKDKMGELRNFIPTESIADDKRAIPAKKYLKYWYKLFNPRQLLIMSCFAKEIHRVIDDLSVDDEEYARAIGTYLSMIFSRHVMKNTRNTMWHNNRKTIEHIFSSRGIVMYWDHPEVNPFIKTSGSIINGINDVLKGLRFALQELNSSQFENKPDPSVEVINTSVLSWETNQKFEYIITDPPYYDDVPYPELFQYFQVWYSKIFEKIVKIPAIPSTSEELSVNQNRSETSYEQKMHLAFTKIHRLLKDDGVLVMFYAHKSIEGWRFVLEALRKSGFKVTSTITLMTESERSLLARGKSSVFHSLVITARKRLENKTANLLDIEDEIRKIIDQKYPELLDIYGNDRVNLMVAASGIVIETITSYSKITSFTKNTADYAIEMGQKYLIETFARHTLAVDHVDVKTMLYTWFRHSPLEDISYTDYNQTLKAFGADERILEDIVKSSRGDVQLIDYSDRAVLEVDGMEPLMATSIIDAVHIALRAYLRGGIIQAKPKIDSSPFGEKPILNTITALAKISATKTGYEEGKVCYQFIRDWYDHHGRPQPTQLNEYSSEKKKDQTKLK